MSLIKRISATLSTRVDRLVSELENQDAIVEAGIRDSRQAYARAKVRHSRVVEEGRRLGRKQEDLRHDTAVWRERATTCDDEDRALECLRRAKQAATQAASVQQILANHADVEQRMQREIRVMRERIESLQHKRHLLRGREAAAEAATCIQRLDDGSSRDLEDAFERWEIKVTEAELTGGTLSEADADRLSDPLERDFVAKEERAALQAELAALRQQRRNQDED